MYSVLPSGFHTEHTHYTHWFVSISEKTIMTNYNNMSSYSLCIKSKRSIAYFWISTVIIPIIFQNVYFISLSISLSNITFIDNRMRWVGGGLGGQILHALVFIYLFIVILIINHIFNDQMRFNVSHSNVFWVPRLS